MPVEDIGRLASVLPKLTKPIQIVGLAIIVAGVVAYRTVPPEYVRGVLAAGSIGIFFLIFGQVFSALPNIPSQQRGGLIVSLVIIFSVFTLLGIALTTYFVVTAEAQSLPLRRLGKFVKPASQADVIKTVDYIHRTGKCDFVVPDLQEADLIIRSIANSKTALPDEVEFARAWEEEKQELHDTICRFVLSYADLTLLPSDFSKNQKEMMRDEVRKAGGLVVSGGDKAMDWLVATIEQEVTNPKEVERYLDEAVNSFVTVAYSRLYTRFQNIPQRTNEVLDPEFVKFSQSIPFGYFDIVKAAIYSSASEEFIVFECGSPASVDRPEGSYSRFTVPVSSIERQEVVEMMRNGPWPVGYAQELFSERWWLKNAIWQMLGREHGKFRSGLGVRIAEYDKCGPP